MYFLVNFFFTIGFVVVIRLLCRTISEAISKWNEEKRKRQQDFDKINETLDHTASLLNEICTILKTR